MKKLLYLLIASVLMVSFTVTGCTKNDSSETTSKDNVSNSQIHFNGSSTLAPVISSIATDFTEEYETWNKVDSSLPEENISIYVSAGGSGAGVKAVLDKSSEFGMVSRELKDTEKEKLKDLKVFELGKDALTISVNPNNPILKKMDNLTTEQIQNIFSGKYKYWDEVDKTLEHKEIVVVIRDLGGGAHGVFQEKVMGDIEVRKDAIQSPSMGALVSKIINNEDAIGYASYGMVSQNEGKLIAMKVDGVEATKANIESGDYKISRPLLVIKEGELTTEQQKFMDVITGDKGKAIIEEMGFVPMNK